MKPPYMRRDKLSGGLGEDELHHRCTLLMPMMDWQESNIFPSFSLQFFCLPRRIYLMGLKFIYSARYVTYYHIHAFQLVSSLDRLPVTLRSLPEPLLERSVSRLIGDLNRRRTYLVRRSSARREPPRVVRLQQSFQEIIFY